MKEKLQRETLWNKIDSEPSVIIYGAQIVAYGIYAALKEVLKKQIKCFVVSDMTNNPNNIDEIPVRQFDEIISQIKGSLVLVATPEIYHEQIAELLLIHDIRNVIYVDTHIEYLIMSRYYQKQDNFKLLEDIGTGENLSQKNQIEPIAMYMARCHVDLPLKSYIEFPEWIKQIQVGAELTDVSISEIKDNDGENISIKNRNYSELTATYWIWKHSEEEYKGICHYRRILVLDYEDIQNIRDNNVNVVLPLPFVCPGDTLSQYGRYIKKEDRQILFKALQEVSPEYSTAADRILKNKYLYNYNMLLADRATFDQYCEWLFPVLKRAEELCEPEGVIRQDRYIGYFGEVLTALYFLYNKNNLKILHGEKKWII